MFRTIERNKVASITTHRSNLLEGAAAEQGLDERTEEGGSVRVWRNLLGPDTSGRETRLTTRQRYGRRWSVRMEKSQLFERVGVSADD